LAGGGAEVDYQANDVLDEFKYEALRRKAKKEGHYKALGMNVIKLFPSHNRIVFRHKMANKLRMILQEIDVLIAEMNAFRFKFKPGTPEPTNYLRQSNSDIIDPTNIVSRSRDDEKKAVVCTLLAQVGNENLTVLPIVGMGGLGKTTLAQLIYNDPEIKKHFQLRLWVCVSYNFDVLKLASAANLRFLPCLESLTIWHCNGLSQVANLPPSIKTLCIYACGNLQS